jgi:hypothetical protein
VKVPNPNTIMRRLWPIFSRPGKRDLKSETSPWDHKHSRIAARAAVVGGWVRCHGLLWRSGWLELHSHGLPTHRNESSIPSNDILRLVLNDYNMTTCVLNDYKMITYFYLSMWTIHIVVLDTTWQTHVMLNCLSKLSSTTLMTIVV